jgi:hypothetical protein
MNVTPQDVIAAGFCSNNQIIRNEQRRISLYLLNALMVITPGTVAIGAATSEAGTLKPTSTTDTRDLADAYAVALAWTIQTRTTNLLERDLGC